MRLAEFICYWAGNYTEEQEKTYRILHGDNKDDWPKTRDYSPMTIDLDRVIRFNPHHDDNKTTVELAGGLSYSLGITYETFSIIMASSCAIENFKTPQDELDQR